MVSLSGVGDSGGKKKSIYLIANVLFFFGKQVSALFG